ncbi:MAG TPA: SMP-30/gluconolactonase/LRE family protein, partial [Acidobacteriota bacterium]|nr:SMP-30/gluconolactonase/LRE family protein [Acidobacteriota bacterium]
MVKRLFMLAIAITMGDIFMLIPGKVSSRTISQPTAEIVRLDPRFDELVPKEATLEKLADGFSWIEGPVWNRAGKFLLFSDVPNNSIFKWNGNDTELFLKPSGYTGSEPFTGREPGSNGLTFDQQGRLVFCQHGNRAISRLEKDGNRTLLVDRYEGKRLNSPNDVIIKSNGDIYFTDPPFGLPKSFEDPGRELDFCGVYRRNKEGEVTLLTKEVVAPNGIAFTADEKTLYVSDSKRLLWLAYDVNADGTLGKSRVLYDASQFRNSKPGVADGLKVDMHGNIFG